MMKTIKRRWSLVIYHLSHNFLSYFILMKNLNNYFYYD